MYQILPSRSDTGQARTGSCANLTFFFFLFFFCRNATADALLELLAAPPNQGKCLYYREWNRPQNTLENADDEGEEQRLMFGMLYSLKVSRRSRPVRGALVVVFARLTAFRIWFCGA